MARVAIRISLATAMAVVFALAVAIDTDASPKKRGKVVTLSADLQSVVDDLVSRMPKRGSEGYRVPTAAQAADLATAYSLMTSGDLQAAANTAAAYGYEVVRFTDSATGRAATMLREAPSATLRGWGLYVRADAPASVALVEVTHPVADFETEDFGVEVFRSLDAEVLFVAGAHRYANADGSADVAHAPVSVFAAIAKAAVRQQSVVIQPHGFSEAKHPGYGEAVVSGGVAPPPERIVFLHDALERHGIDTCTYDGVACKNLAGTTNLQGKDARAAGALFAHLEFVRLVRTDPIRRAAAIAAIRETFG